MANFFSTVEITTRELKFSHKFFARNFSHFARRGIRPLGIVAMAVLQDWHRNVQTHHALVTRRLIWRLAKEYGDRSLISLTLRLHL
jgi:hypothetical protein